jgi:cytoskeletal protein CcmA (bactofilin family)
LPDSTSTIGNGKEDVMMRMKRKWIALALLGGLAFLAAMIPNVAGAQESRAEKGGVLLRIDGNVRLGMGESAESVFVIDGNAVIDGTVEDFLLVIDGNAIINGRVNGDVQVVSGSLALSPNARVSGDVNLWRSDLTQANGSVIGGDVNRMRSWDFTWVGAAFSLYIWVAITVTVVLAALVFAAVGGRQLRAATNNISGRPGQTMVASLITVIGLPLVAAVAIATLVGIPFGIGIVLFLIPALWFLGYIVAGAWLGGLIVRSARPASANGEHPYLAAFVGVVLLQLVALLPFVGWMAAFLVGLLGVGALSYTAWRGFRGGGETPTPTPAPPAPTSTPAAAT